MERFGIPFGQSTKFTVRSGESDTVSFSPFWRYPRLNPHRVRRLGYRPIGSRLVNSRARNSRARNSLRRSPKADSFTRYSV